ncbi:MAG: hypothetical protein U9Q98_11870, partial [Bacteroidota bacterium]|nr:hypothetical protein [Bacteroidota bacterium]
MNVEKDIKKTRLQPNIQIKKAQKPSDTIQTQNSQTEITQDSIIQTNSTKKTHYLKGYDFGYDDSSQNKTPQTRAAPANDDICSASALPMDGSCINDETNIQSTSDYFGGCIPNGSPSVFYEFTVSGTNDMVSVTLSDFAEFDRKLYFMLLSGNCSSPTVESAFCTSTPLSSSGSITQSFYNLQSGVTYYVMIATQPGVGNSLSNYDICGEEQIAPLLITGPEQDCSGAIPVCEAVYTQENSYTGYGDVADLVTGQTCLAGGETNSVWYVFTPQSNGDMQFVLETEKDYDWALYDLTDIGGCENIASSSPVLCNYSGTLGNTGTDGTVDNTIPRSEDDTGNPLMSSIDVTAGTNYALIVDNYTADATGYTLTFSGSASIVDDPANGDGEYPYMESASVSCDDSTFVIQMNEPVECLSIGQGDLSLTNTTTSTDYSSAISYITGGDCTSSELTNTLIIKHDGSLTTGQYEIDANPGATIADKCGNVIDQSIPVTIDYLAELSLTASNTTICGGESISLDADGADNSVTYTLNPGGLTNSTDGIFAGLTPSITTTYTVSATWGGCTREAQESVTVEGNIVVSIDPASKTVCDFTSDVTLTASTSINGSNCSSCSYSWSTSETTQSIDVSAEGTYTVSSTTINGCTSFNTAESIITLAGGGSGGNSCDVLYVSPTGGGTGLTKDSPTTLANAVDEAVCTNTTIKMQVGVYNLSNFQYVPSYITIEGGYDSDFLTKSSDMSGGSNSTTIRRSSTNDVDNRPTTPITYPTDCSAFRVDDGAEEFRIQNLRIEMPGSPNVSDHAASSGLINYGIKLGTSCKEYNIVRIYIDAGVGA